ncbi:glycosyltransferase [uncultured Amaricoccus sp.]|uniref:glycosyltransferase family protein n=1 Tax=uncultured Amaricoccus sp. TaxID=339341 RepID=UPI0026175B3C|nr:glycosyltransferase [uncultured Amaricoccus sp.]
MTEPEPELLAPDRSMADGPVAGKQLYIAWIGFQRRAESMRQFLGFELHHVPPPFGARALKPIGYLLQAIRTARILRAARPDTVWLQSPPAALPQLALALRYLGRRRFRILVDGHDAAFTPPWSRFPGTVAAMNRCDRVLAHNTEMRGVAEALGIAPERLRVLEDPPPRLDLVARPPTPETAAETETAPYVLVPCSFGADERALVPMVLAAAARLPELRFKITGRRSKAEALGFTNAASANVDFTDYLSLPDFEALLAGAAVVLGITTRQNSQLSVANEALGAHCALVLSDTPTLRAIFGAAALFARNDPESFAETLAEAVASRDALRARSEALKIRRRSSWLAEARAASGI